MFDQYEQMLEVRKKRNYQIGVEQLADDRVLLVAEKKEGKKLGISKELINKQVDVLDFR